MLPPAKFGSTVKKALKSRLAQTPVIATKANRRQLHRTRAESSRLVRRRIQSRERKSGEPASLVGEPGASQQHRDLFADLRHQVPLRASRADQGGRDELRADVRLGEVLFVHLREVAEVAVNAVAFG